MANYVAGHVSNPDDMDSCIGVEFETPRNCIVAYIDNEEISLTYEQAWQLRGLMRSAIVQYEWHNATWLSVSEGLLMSTRHLMRKDGYDRGAKTLCGQHPTDFSKIIGGWKTEPILGAPSRDRRNKFTGGTCQRCLAIYDKQASAPESEASNGK